MEYRGRPLVHPETIAEWRSWLAEHHADTDGVWLATWKRASGKTPLDYGAIVEEALCFGWIDGLVNTLPDGRQAQLLTPRRRGSGWSGSNKERVQRLVADGRMTEAGMRVIDAAKADGVVIYTIFLDIGGTHGNSAPLRYCATDATKYYDLTTTSAVVGTFKQIAQQITNVRVVK